MNEALWALNRFGMGARAGEARRLGDPRRWLRDQVRRGAPKLEGAPPDDEVLDAVRRFRAAQRKEDRAAIRTAAAGARTLVLREARAALSARVASPQPFVERLVAFWSNHLCISLGAGPLVAPLAGHYERKVIRPHVLGRFAEMVLASARHPAMLLYLDNARSIGPGSRAAHNIARRRGRKVGLNENYARELLELHTVGVDAGYTQRDVEALARIFTGWTVAGVGPGSRTGERPGFAFRGPLHEPGSKTVLGRRYGEAGRKEGEEAIRDLCRHPATARHLARKLAIHFVADDPPESAVAALEKTYLESGGDLAALSLRLVDLGEAWDPANRKFRTPQDWLVAVFRAVHATEAPEPMVAYLDRLRHPLWNPNAPRGFGDTAGEWADPDSLMNRAELSRTLARHMARRGRRREGPNPELLLTAVGADPGDPLSAMAADEGLSLDERLALVVAGPAFQWR